MRLAGLILGCLLLVNFYAAPAIALKAEDLAAEKAKAEAGDIMAQVNVGDHYDGRNCPEALKWYRMAAKQGQFDARMRIANYYAYGECPGVARDVVKGYVLYKKILDNYVLHPESQGTFEQQVLELEKELSPEQLADAEKRIAEPWQF